MGGSVAAAAPSSSDRFPEMDDAQVVKVAAAKLVAERGAKAPGFAVEQAEIAAGLGDRDSAAAWRDIGNAAFGLLGAVPPGQRPRP